MKHGRHWKGEGRAFLDSCCSPSHLSSIYVTNSIYDLQQGLPQEEGVIFGYDNDGRFLFPVIEKTVFSPLTGLYVHLALCFKELCLLGDGYSEVSILGSLFSLMVLFCLLRSAFFIFRSTIIHIHRELSRALLTMCRRGDDLTSLSREDPEETFGPYFQKWERGFGCRSILYKLCIYLFGLVFSNLRVLLPKWPTEKFEVTLVKFWWIFSEKIRFCQSRLTQSLYLAQGTLLLISYKPVFNIHTVFRPPSR